MENYTYALKYGLNWDMSFEEILEGVKNITTYCSIFDNKSKLTKSFKFHLNVSYSVLSKYWFNQYLDILNGYIVNAFNRCPY